MTQDKTFTRRVSIADAAWDVADERIRAAFAELKAEAAAEVAARFANCGHFNGDMQGEVTQHKETQEVTIELKLFDRGLPVWQAEPTRHSDTCAEYGDWVFSVLADGRLEIVHVSKTVRTAGEPMPLELGATP